MRQYLFWIGLFCSIFLSLVFLLYYYDQQCTTPPENNDSCAIHYEGQGIWGLYLVNPKNNYRKRLETYRSHRNALDNATSWGCKNLEEK